LYDDGDDDAPFELVLAPHVVVVVVVVVAKVAAAAAAALKKVYMG
jgi:hypothetical protein